jgi:PHD/YefM family antitoxin component YafN of YafNO toxin-antitoxin module
MGAINERYLTDEQGNRVAVVLNLEEYNKILEELEELDDLRAFDEAKSLREQPILIEQAIAEIERKRKGK